MKKNNFKIIYICGKLICVGGIGKMFYQDGFPISMAVSILQEKGIDVSVLHVADECIKNGWTGKTTFNKLKVDFEDDKGIKINLTQLKEFCFADYKQQREIIFQSLFGNTSDYYKSNIAELLIKIK